MRGIMDETFFNTFIINEMAIKCWIPWKREKGHHATPIRRRRERQGNVKVSTDD